MSKEALLSRGSNRKAFVDISPEVILGLLKIHPEGEVVNGMRIQVVEDAIPEDAKPIGCGISPDGNVRIVMVSGQFEELQEGCVARQLNPRYQVSTEED